MKKDLLKNPFVVAGLIVTAICFIFVNNIMPLMKSDEVSADETTLEENSQQGTMDNPVVTEQSPNEGTGTQKDKPMLLLKDNLLKTQGWIRTSSRDPFENKRTENDTDSKSIVIADTGSKNVTVGITLNTIEKKSRQKGKSLLKAISVGTIEKVALIGSSVYHEGDSCTLGIVKTIDPDSVIISGPGGIRILHLYK
jgi:hypothetical protein